VKRLLALSLAFPLLAAAAPPASVSAGEAVYARCLGCHALAYDRTGPRHCGLFGRRAGSVTGFQYSAPMKASDIIWSARTLDRFLENPARAVPGTTMGYAGVADRSERAALIAYLKSVNGTAQCQSLSAAKK
jgi:cytochrome c